MNGRVLIVDDDLSHAESLRRTLSQRQTNITIDLTSNLSKARELIKNEYDVIILDLVLDSAIGPSSGFELLTEINSTSSFTRTIVLTGYIDDRTGIQALRLGAANFLSKPVNLDHLAALVSDGVVQSKIRRESRSRVVSFANRELVGRSVVMEQVKQEVAFAASNSMPVLVLGETGTGKGVVARLIHDLSAMRANLPFVRYQPSGASGDVVSGELFGYSKGAFTGAVSAHSGIFHEVGEGTLFLDEIDELPQVVQVALLGVLQEGKIRRIGEVSERVVGFKVVAASNRPIDSLLKGGIRADLYHRLAQIQIKLPALRERRSDIPDLISHFIQEMRDELSRPDLSVRDQEISCAMDYDWPGNVRELQAVVRKAAYLAAQSGGRLLDLKIERGYKLTSEYKLVVNESCIKTAPKADLRAAIRELTIRLIDEALALYEGNVSLAARKLGVDRNTIRRYRRT